MDWRKLIIFPGDRIDNNLIVGAASLVAKDIPPNSIVKGQPARIFKEIRGEQVLAINF